MHTVWKGRYFVFCLSHNLTWLQIVTLHYGWVSLVISNYPASLGDHRPFGRGNIKLSICRVTSRDHMVRGSYDIMGEIFIISNHSAKFSGHRHLHEKIFCFYFLTWLHVTAWSESHVTSWVSFPRHKWLPCQIGWL